MASTFGAVGTSESLRLVNADRVNPKVNAIVTLLQRCRLSPFHRPRSQSQRRLWMVHAQHQRMQGLFYSIRNACMGSMEAAPHAGKNAAIRPHTTTVNGSCWPTPKRNDLRSRVAIHVHASPRPSPQNTSTEAFLRMSSNTSRRSQCHAYTHLACAPIH